MRRASFRGTRVGAPMNLIQNGVLQRRIADRMQLKEFSPAPTLAPEIQPVILVDDISKADREETQIIASLGTSQAAVAAQNAIYELRNPTGSNILCRLRFALFTHTDNAANAHVLIGTRSASLGGSAAAPIWNTRTPVVFGQCTFGGFSQVGTVGASQIADYFQQPFTPPMRVDLEGLILPPGQSLIVQNATVNMTTACTFGWIEESIGR